MRRQMYVHGPDWRVLVIAKTPDQMKVAYKEIMQILQASSMAVTGHEYTFADKPWIELNGTSRLIFAHVNTIERAYMFAGHEYAHLIWLYEPDDQNIRVYARSWLRSSIAPHEELIDEKVDW